MLRLQAGDLLLLGGEGAGEDSGGEQESGQQQPDCDYERRERESVGVGWRLESELPLRPDVPCVLSPQLQQGLHHSPLYCTADYCTTEKL